MSLQRLQASFACLLVVFGNVVGAAASGGTPELILRKGSWHGRSVTYELVNGQAVYQGDILLGAVDPAPTPTSGAALRFPSAVVAYSSFLWPKVAGVAIVFYVIDSQSSDLSNINAAINQFNSDFAGVIQWVQRTSQPTFVDINLNGGATGQCEAEEGYQPNSPQPQPMGGASNCSIATILHEMGHVIGLWHEQSRSDRNSFVTVNFQNVIKGSRFNFDIIQDNIQNQTPYDYASLMQYPAFVQTRNGGPSLETIPPGIPLGGTEGVPVAATDYSAADKEGILRLYGTPPTSITVTSNPPNLQLVVDGSTCTAPCVETWALNSQHTLDVGPNVQTVSGDVQNSSPPVATTYYYTFGNWNDGGAQSHTVTITAGNGEPGFSGADLRII